jgi:hypothetical protein
VVVIPCGDALWSALRLVVLVLCGFCALWSLCLVVPCGARFALLLFLNSDKQFCVLRIFVCYYPDCRMLASLRLLLSFYHHLGCGMDHAWAYVAISVV